MGRWPTMANANIFQDTKFQRDANGCWQYGTHSATIDTLPASFSKLARRVVISNQLHLQMCCFLGFSIFFFRVILVFWTKSRCFFFFEKIHTIEVGKIFGWRSILQGTNAVLFQHFPRFLWVFVDVFCEESFCCICSKVLQKDFFTTRVILEKLGIVFFFDFNSFFFLFIGLPVKFQTPFHPKRSTHHFLGCVYPLLPYSISNSFLFFFFLVFLRNSLKLNSQFSLFHFINFDGIFTEHFGYTNVIFFWNSI